jgi:hypothetical protein
VSVIDDHCFEGPQWTLDCTTMALVKVSGGAGSGGAGSLRRTQAPSDLPFIALDPARIDVAGCRLLDGV